MRARTHTRQAKSLKVACYNNLAMCFLKLEMWAKAVDNADRALQLEPSNCKARKPRSSSALVSPSLPSLSWMRIRRATQPPHPAHSPCPLTWSMGYVSWARALALGVFLVSLWPCACMRALCLR